MKTELRVLLRQCYDKAFFFSVTNGKIEIDTPKGKLSPHLHEQLSEWKSVLLLLFTTYAKEEIPVSFLEKPCSRCGLYDDARKTEEGVWVCACYFDVKYNLNPIYWRPTFRQQQMALTA
jgi:hypothetical protein